MSYLYRRMETFRFSMLPSAGNVTIIGMRPVGAAHVRRETTEDAQARLPKHWGSRCSHRRHGCGHYCRFETVEILASDLGDERFKHKPD